MIINARKKLAVVGAISVAALKKTRAMRTKTQSRILKPLEMMRESDAEPLAEPRQRKSASSIAENAEPEGEGGNRLRDAVRLPPGWFRRLDSRRV